MSRKVMGTLIMAAGNYIVFSLTEGILLPVAGIMLIAAGTSLIRE